MPHQYWIADIVCQPATEEKIWKKHHVTLQEVEEAVLYTRAESAYEHVDPVRGPRIIAIGRTFGGARILAILKLVNRSDDVYELKSARRWSR